MRWALRPTITAASIWGECGWQRLWRPGVEPGVEMAGSGVGSTSEPGVEMAGFEFTSRRYLPTVSRLMSSSRAIRRWDQSLGANWSRATGVIIGLVIDRCRIALFSLWP